MTTSLQNRGEETLKVYVRVRPPILKEVQFDTAVMVQGDQTISIVSDNKEATCTYDHVFNELTQQEEVFEYIKPLLVDVLAGVNSCIFAYGQTSSGKSYTMVGPNGGVDLTKTDKSLWGILPRASEFLMGYLNEKVNEGTMTFEAKASFLQIYNENLYDLLKDSGPMIEERLIETRNATDRDNKDSDLLRIREVPKPRSKLASTKELPKEVYVSGLSEFRVQTSEDILRIVTVGTQNRITRSTDFNATSSRSHALLQLTFEIESVSPTGQTLISKSKLNLIDLAGSEKLPIYTENTTKHVRELSNINKSLSALGNVIAALASTTRSHIPYRDSKLTRLLQDSLSGNTRTILVACLAPTVMHTLESMSTLQFAERAKNVKLSVRANTMVDDKLTLAKAQNEVARLKALLSHAMKQLAERDGGSGGGAGGEDYERLVVENDKLKQENASLRRLARSNKLSSFDDNNSVSSARSNRSNRSNRSARKGGGGGGGFLSSVERFPRGGAGAGAGGVEFFSPGINRLSQPKKHRTPKKHKNEWDRDLDSDGGGGGGGGYSNNKRRGSEDAGLWDSPAPRRSQVPVSQRKPPPSYMNRVYAMINERQSQELHLMLEEAQRRAQQEQQQQQLQMQMQLQHNAMLDPQQQVLLYQQALMGAANANGAGGAQGAGNGPTGGVHLPPGGLAPLVQQALFPPGGSNNNAMQFSPPTGSNSEASEFYPLGHDEGKHIPIIAISGDEGPAVSNLPPLSNNNSNNNHANRHQESQGRAGVAGGSANPSASLPTQPAQPPKPIVKPLPPVTVETEPPTNRIFLKKAGAPGAGAMKTLQGVHPPNQPPSSQSSMLPQIGGGASLLASAVSSLYSQKAPPPGATPPSPQAIQLRGYDDIGRSVDVFSFRSNQWERGEIMDYDEGKRMYKVRWINGTVSYVDLSKKPVRGA